MFKQKSNIWSPLIALLACAVLLSSKPVHAAPATSIVYWPAAVPADNITPFGVYVSFTGGTPNTDYYATVYLFSDTAYGNSNPQSRNWRSDLDPGSWQNSGGANNNRIVFTTDTNGDWSSWIYVQVNEPTSYTIASLRARIRPVAVTGNVDDTRTVDLLDMRTTATVNEGGWLEESFGIARDGRNIVVRNDSNDIVGIYAAKLNGIDDGYSSSSGYYRVGVPSCMDCGYTIETWESNAPGAPVGQINIMGENGCPNNVGVGVVQSMNSCETPTAVTLHSLTTTATNPLLLIIILMVGLTAGSLALLRRRQTT